MYLESPEIDYSPFLIGALVRLVTLVRMLKVNQRNLLAACFLKEEVRVKVGSNIFVKGFLPVTTATKMTKKKKKVKMKGNKIITSVL